MAQSVRQHIAYLLLSDKRRRRYIAVFALMAVMTSLCVAGILSRNGIAMTHEETVLDCQYDGNGAHAHNADCYDADGNLVCPLPERELHFHDDSCYTKETHIVCGQEESEDHTHSDACYKTTRTLTCGQEEVTEEHVHGSGCFTTITVADDDTGASSASVQLDNLQADASTSSDAKVKDLEQIALVGTAPQEEAGPIVEQKEPKLVTDATALAYSDDSIKVTVNVMGVEGLPADARLAVTPVTKATEGYNYNAYMAALKNEAKNSDSITEENTLFYDVAIMSGGVEWEPTNGGKVEVSFEFIDNQLIDQLGVVNPETVTVTHLPVDSKVMEQYDTTKDATSISADDIMPEPLDASVAQDAENLSFEVEGLSVFALNNNSSTVNVSLDIDALADTKSMLVKDKNVYAYLASVGADGKLNSSTRIYGTQLHFTDSKKLDFTIEGVPQGTYKLILAYPTDTREMPSTGDMNTLSVDAIRYVEDGGYFYGFNYHEPTELVEVSDSTYALSAGLNLIDLPDSLAGVDTEQIMDRAFHYGITADQYENAQQSFANIAVKEANVTNQNAGDGNYFGPRAGDIVVPYIIADLTSDFDPNNPDQAKILHSGDKQTNFYVTEKDSIKVDSADKSNTIVRDQNEIRDRVEIMISNTLKMAKKLSDNAAVSIPRLETVDFSAYPDGATINLNADALDGLDRNFTIIKRPGQTVVFNFTGTNPVPPMNIVVKEVDDNGDVTATYTAGDSMKEAPASDGIAWSKIVWNFPNAENVNTRNDIGGVFITPGNVNVNKGGGWIVSGGKVTIQNPWYGFPSADEPFKQKEIVKTFVGLEPGDKINPEYVLHLMTHVNESTSGTTHKRLIADLVLKSKDDSSLGDDEVGYESMVTNADGTIVVTWKTPSLSVGNEHKLTENHSTSVNNAQVELVEFEGPYSYWSDIDEDYVWTIHESSYTSEADFNAGNGVFNVSARDMKDGQDRLHVYVTNHYKVDKNPHNLTLNKVVVDPEGIEQEGQKYNFEITLKDDHGTALTDQTIKYTLNGGEEQDLTVTGGTATIYLKAGDVLKLFALPYGTQYTIVEKELPSKCEVEFSGDTASKTEASGKLIKDREVTATNTFSDDPGVPITAHKDLQDGVLRDDQFTYRLVDSSGTLIKQATNDANGNIEFGPLVFERDGDYTYTLYEVADPEMTDIVFDTTEYSVRLKVEGGRVREVTYSNESGESTTIPMFRNKKITPDPDVLTARKVFIDKVTGKAVRLAGDDFTFTADTGDGTIYTGKNDADGKVVFKDREGKELDINDLEKTTHFTIRETCESFAGSVPADRELEYDGSSYQATATVEFKTVETNPVSITQGDNNAVIVSVTFKPSVSSDIYYFTYPGGGATTVTPRTDGSVTMNIPIWKNQSGTDGADHTVTSEYGVGDYNSDWIGGVNRPHEKLGDIAIVARSNGWGASYPIEVQSVSIPGVSLSPTTTVEKTVTLAYEDGHYPVFKNYLNANEPDTIEFPFTKVWVNNATYANPEIWETGKEIATMLTGSFTADGETASSGTKTFVFKIKRVTDVVGNPYFEFTQPEGDNAPQIEVANVSAGDGHYRFVITNLPERDTVGEKAGTWSYSLTESPVDGYEVSYGSWDPGDDKAVPDHTLDTTGISPEGYLINARISVELPHAGGIGTAAFTACGAALIVAGVCMFLLRLAQRRMWR